MKHFMIMNRFHLDFSKNQNSGYVIFQNKHGEQSHNHISHMGSSKYFIEGARTYTKIFKNFTEKSEDGIQYEKAKMSVQCWEEDAQNPSLISLSPTKIKNGGVVSKKYLDDDNEDDSGIRKVIISQ